MSGRKDPPGEPSPESPAGSPDYELDDQRELTSIAQVKAIADPLREAIVDLLLERAATISELAQALGRPKGTVAYHVKVLLEADILKVVRSRKVRAVTEHYYGRTARLHFVGALKALDSSGQPIFTNYLATAATESIPANANFAFVIGLDPTDHPHLTQQSG